jgi:hypothetical protein
VGLKRRDFEQVCRKMLIRVAHKKFLEKQSEKLIAIYYNDAG